MLNRALPWAALALTLIIWAGYLVVTRAAMKANLTPLDVGLLRSIPAALCLIPFIWRKGLIPQGTTWRDFVGIGVLGGTCFIVVLATGLSFAPVADSGIFAPSMLPVFIALLSLLLFGERPSGLRLVGLALILTGALAIGGLSALLEGNSGAWRGHILFLTGSCLWALYTLTFRASRLSALTGTWVMVATASVLFLAATPFVHLRMFELSTPAFTVQLVQGFGSGLIANLTFLYAVTRLGTVIPAASAALVPVLAALGGWLFLGEALGPMKILGIGVVMAGILLASGVNWPRTK